MIEPFSSRMPAQSQPMLLTLWGAFLQAFTVENTVERKLK
jgi:hypothetical protein